MRVSISFDYDSPAGYQESFNKASTHAAADIEGTDAILKVLQKHDVRTTFAVVGKAALDGPSPEHAPDQIRNIHRAGHEVASHSMYHRFIPPMLGEDLIQDLYQSKHALEACIGHSVCGFVPPFNRPFHFPEMGSFSISERIGLHGRGRGRQSVDNLLRCLKSMGYGWCRVSYQPQFRTALKKLGMLQGAIPRQPFLHRDIVAIPLSCTGFGPAATELLRRHMNSDILVTLFGHPFQALDSRRGGNDEHVDCLDEMLTTFSSERRDGTIRFITMAEVETEFRTNVTTPVPETVNA